MDETKDNDIASQAHAQIARKERLDDLRADARYSSERLRLYRARLYSGRPVSLRKMRELERASEGAAARLQRGRKAAGAPHP
jgi:hypothetical protein